MAESLYRTDPNHTWKEIVQKQVVKGLTGMIFIELLFRVRSVQGHQ